VIGRRVMLTATKSRAWILVCWLDRDLGRRYYPGVSYIFLESCRAAFVFALVTASCCVKTFSRGKSLA